jgi:LPXTG-site transpeptidase (sortase) family protein
LVDPSLALTEAFTSVLSSLAASTVASTTVASQRMPGAVTPASPPSGRPPRPIWITIPAIAVNAPVVPVGLEPGGIMASPGEADIVGWYELGPRPGEPSNAILAGHVNWRGEVGAFARLHELQAGDIIEIQSGPQTGFRYVVESAKTYQADTVPVAEIFGESAEPVLTLITCGGPYDSARQAYRDRLVIRARGQ